MGKIGFTNFSGAFTFALPSFALYLSIFHGPLQSLISAKIPAVIQSETLEMQEFPTMSQILQLPAQNRLTCATGRALRILLFFSS